MKHKGGNLWTSLHAADKITWVWESTGRTLYPGYANWCPGQPDNLGEQCGLYNGAAKHCWNDYTCSDYATTNGGICELQP